MLGAFGNLTVKFKEVRFFECFVAEIVVTIIAVVDNGRIEQGCVVSHNFIDLFGNERRIFAGFGVFVQVQPLNRARERLVGLFVQV